jgi:hypothetical protein
MPLPVENLHVILYVIGSPCGDLGLSSRAVRSILPLAVLIPVLSKRVSGSIVCINRDTSAVIIVSLVNNGTGRLGQRVLSLCIYSLIPVSIYWPGYQTYFRYQSAIKNWPTVLGDVGGWEFFVLYSLHIKILVSRPEVLNYRSRGFHQSLQARFG